MNPNRILALALVLLAIPALAQEHGNGGGQGGSGSGESSHGSGGGGGCGDAFGDLVHVKRDELTGQPILQKRTVEDKGEVTTAYCPIPIDGTGREIGFAAMSCDPVDPKATIEVNYFGRLSGGRTKERNSRMHFDEVVSSIGDPAVGRVSRDDTGRLRLGYDCTENVRGARRCREWHAVDSPMENLAIYARVIRYGHLQTDPAEVDTWAHGDPSAGPQLHPALGPEDYRKFDPELRHLLPGGEDGAGRAATCFAGGSFNPACATGEPLDTGDFVRAAAFLAGAANKNGVITTDLVQYMNRILKVTRDTEMSASTVETLPALVRDCGPDNELPDPAVSDKCVVYPAREGLPWPADERFLDFGAARYDRSRWHDRTLQVIQPAGGRAWREKSSVRLMQWLNFVNGKQRREAENIEGFVQATSDSLRAIEFVHNYAVPEHLWPAFLAPMASDTGASTGLHPVKRMTRPGGVSDE